MVRTADRCAPHPYGMVVAWIGALCMLILLLRTPAAGWLAHSALPLLPMSGAVAGMLWLLTKRRFPSMPTYAACVVLGALFASIGFCLTIMCGRLLG